MIEFHAVTCPFCHGSGNGGRLGLSCGYCDGTGRIVIRSREPRRTGDVKAWVWFTIIVTAGALFLIYLTRLR